MMMIVYFEIFMSEMSYFMGNNYKNYTYFPFGVYRSVSGLY